MWIFLNILSSLHYITTGCTPSSSGLTNMSAVSGESVLLPCSCSDPRDRPTSVAWKTNSRRASKDHIYTDISTVFERYSDRITLLNQTSPGNVSLLLSDVTEDDQGSYVCWLDKTSRFIDVYIKVPIKKTNPALSKTSLSVLISVLLLTVPGGAAVIYYIHKARRKARLDSGERNVENNWDDDNSTYGILQKKYVAEEMYGTIGNRSKEQ